MGKPPRKSSARLDRVRQALADLTEVASNHVFSAAEAREAFAKARRRRAREPRRIADVGLADNGELAILAQPGSPNVMVRITHARFNAEITADYDPRRAEVTAAEVTSIEGDLRQAERLADRWMDQMTGLDQEDEDRNDADPTGEYPPPFTGEYPPPSTGEDANIVAGIAARLARGMQHASPAMDPPAEGLMILEERPQMLWPILDGLVEACSAPRRDAALVSAWRYLLVSQLTLIRYSIDRDWAWARQMAEACQARLVAIGTEGRVPPEDFTAMIGAFGEARIGLTDEAKMALAHANMGPEGVPDGDMQAALRALLEEMAAALSDPFDVCAGLGDSLRSMPGEIRALLAYEFALSPHAVLRDTVAMLLLAEDQQVRRTATAALDQIAAPDTMSPDTLRRMIAIRNWIPQADRSPLDRVIRKARVNGVTCAQWPAPRQLGILATAIDGAGCMSLVMATPGRGTGLIGGILLKITSGVADAWCHTAISRREIQAMQQKMRDATEAADVARSCLDRIIQNAIAVGVGLGTPPGPELLQLAEIAGGTDWQDRRIDVPAEAQALFDALPAPRRSAAAIAASLARSGRWIDTTEMAESWFLDDAQSRAVLARGRRRDAHTPSTRLLQEVLPARRAEWAERCLLMALRGRASKDRGLNQQADDFVILAHLLSGETALAEIPLMRAIADHTVRIAASGRP